MDSSDRRLVIVHNPASSRAKLVEQNVFGRLDAAGYRYTILEVEQASLSENIERLKKCIQPHDLIICATGDGSSHAVGNSIIASKQPGVSVGFLAYGNFNDMPRSVSRGSAQTDPVTLLQTATEQPLYPLAVELNGQFLRYAFMYATIGWTALAAKQYDRPEVRQTVSHRTNLLRNIWRLGVFYFKTAHHARLIPFEQDGVRYTKRDDILFMNGGWMAHLFRRNDRLYGTSVFLTKRLRVSNLLANIPFLSLALMGRMPGKKVQRTSVVFSSPASFVLQCDGEVIDCQDTRTLTVTKPDQPLMVLTTR